MLSDHWAIIGGGPSAAAYALRDGVCVIATNDGISHEPNPDYYYLNDAGMCEKHHDDAVRAKREGTCLLTVERSSGGINGRGLQIVDVRLKCRHEPNARYPFKRGEFTYHPLSGCMCVQFAANASPKRIDLYGFEGYAAGDYRESKNKMQAELLQNVVEKCPDIAFVWHGQPRYEIVGRNVSVLSLA